MSRIASHAQSRGARQARLAGAGIVLVSSVALVALVGACGARGPLDDAAPLDGDAGAGDVLAPDVLVPDPDASPPPQDVSPDPRPGGGNVLSCGTCLVGQCSQGILKCVQTPSCQKTLQCAANKCLSGGAPDLSCFFKCAAGDPSGALQIIQIFMCVTGKCGADCNAVLGGLGGGGGGNKKDAGRAQAAHPFAQALYSQWPELVCH